RRIQNHDAVIALGPVPLYVESYAKVQREFPGELESIPTKDGPVEVLVSGSSRFGHTATVTVSEQEGSEAIAATAVGARSAKARVFGIGRCRLRIELVQASRIVALVVVVAEDTILSADLQRVPSEDLSQHRAEAGGVVEGADAASGSLCAPTAAPSIVTRLLRHTHLRDVGVGHLAGKRRPVRSKLR